MVLADKAALEEEKAAAQVQLKDLILTIWLVRTITAVCFHGIAAVCQHITVAEYIT